MLGQNYVFIFDEYYDCLMSSKLAVAKPNVITPIHQLGVYEDLLIVTGHYSKTFMAFLRERFTRPIQLISCNTFDWLKQEADR
jgi:hypothetical protein